MTTTFTQRVGQVLEGHGIPVEAVTAESLVITPSGTRFLLRYEGSVEVTAAEAAAIVGPHTGDTTCPTCYSVRQADAGDRLPIVFCTDPAPTEEPAAGEAQVVEVQA